MASIIATALKLQNPPENNPEAMSLESACSAATAVGFFAAKDVMQAAHHGAVLLVHNCYGCTT
jgi:3-hydroxy-3-methylglutaryl CoA synthase